MFSFFCFVFLIVFVSLVWQQFKFVAISSVAANIFRISLLINRKKNYLLKLVVVFPAVCVSACVWVSVCVCVCVCVLRLNTSLTGYKPNKKLITLTHWRKHQNISWFGFAGIGSGSGSDSGSGSGSAICYIGMGRGKLLTIASTVVGFCLLKLPKTDVAIRMCY